jgi:hypothetical protein
LVGRVVTVLIVLLVAGCGPAELDAGDAWVRLPAAPGRPGVAYFTVNGGPEARRLTRVTADQALRAEMHESMGADGRMSMRPLADVPVPPGEDVVFAPGGRHVMLYDLDPKAKRGGNTILTLTFDNGFRLYRKAYIIGAGDPVPE